jgi:hypothetical protein
VFSGTVPGGGIDGHDISGSASFAISGSNLLITLTNTLTTAVGFQDQILQGVVWQQIGIGTLTTVSAIASNVVNSSSYNGPLGDVGGEWAYKIGAPSPALGSADRQIYGAGTYGGGDPNGTNPVFFPKTSVNNLGGPTNPDGAQYGIISANTSNPSSIGGFEFPPNGNDPDANGLVRDQILFTLGLSDDFKTGQDTYAYSFDNVALFFGTSPGGVVPIPPTALLLGGGLLGLCLLGYRRRKS